MTCSRRLKEKKLEQNTKLYFSCLCSEQECGDSTNENREKVESSHDPTFESHVNITLSQPKEGHFPSPENEKIASVVVSNQPETPTVKSKESSLFSRIHYSVTDRTQALKQETGSTHGHEKMETHNVSQTSTFYKPSIASFEKKELKVDRLSLDQPSDAVNIFGQNAKIYCFNEDQDEWLERGFGALQILRHHTRFHIYMKDDVSSKVCVAHGITPDMDLKPNAGSDRSWVWFTLADHSNEPAIPQELAAEFESVENSVEFKRKFDECRDLCGVPHEGHVRAMAASFNSNLHELPGLDRHVPQTKPVTEMEDSLWRTCTACQVENNVSNTKCLVCGAQLSAGIKELEAKKLQTKVPPAIREIISVKDMKPTLSTSKHHLARPRVQTSVKRETFQAVTEWWKCSSCGVENNVNTTSCVICSNPKVLEKTTDMSSSSLPFGDTPVKETERRDLSSTSDVAKTFGSSSSSDPMSFSDLASSTATFQISTDTINFPGRGSPVFGKTSEEVSLVRMSKEENGDEQDECVFSQHAKLLRFHPQVGEWKEKGHGTLKILRNISTQRVRIVMRRDKVLSLCANHYITPEMKLKAPDDTDKAWLWTAQDYSSEEMSVENLAVVFKSSELAAEFKKVFDDCSTTLREGSTKQLEPDDPATTQYYEGVATCSPEISRLLSEVIKR